MFAFRACGLKRSCGTKIGGRFVNTSSVHVSFLTGGGGAGVVLVVVFLLNHSVKIRSSVQSTSSAGSRRSQSPADRVRG